ncbi:MAG: ribose-phosphate pyrophosphokinase [Nitrospirae bacterium]|nr:ribose-phosphate pyrophosphokinase [Nitrospirota bacterium]
MDIRGTVFDDIRVFSGNANRPLAEEVCRFLGIPMGEATVSTFSDGEILVQIDENVRGKDVFLIQPLSHPVNNHLMEMLIMIDALRRSSAKRITAVIPYFGYARQDRKSAPRVPITAKLVADLITVAGTSRVLTLDLHAGQIQGFFNIPVDHLYAKPVLLEYLNTKEFNNLVVVSPDAGGTERARAFAKKLNASLAIIDKRRESPNKAQLMNIIGDVAGHDVLLLDDMIDTGGTIVQAAQALKERGALKVYGACTHPVLSGPAVDRLKTSAFDELILTDTIPLGDKAERYDRFTVLSVAGLLGQAVARVHTEESISSLFV